MSGRHALDPSPAGRDAASAPPTFRVLSRAECDALLRRAGVARLAYTFHGRVDIEPIHYACDGEWIVGRTAPGAKLDALSHAPWVALEVDDVRGTFDWESVVVHGTLYRLQPAGSDVHRESWERAVPLLRRLVPEALAADDPVPFRDVLFQIHVDEVTGRAASTGEAHRPAPHAL